MQGSGGLADACEKRIRHHCLRGLFCCFLRPPGEEPGVRTGGDVGQGKQTALITVEDLGTENAGFSLLDEEPPRRGASGPLAQHAVHLIPPTPSGTTDEGQFFDVSPTEGGEHGSSTREQEDAPADPSLVGEDERDPLLSETSEDEGKELGFSRSSQQGASLAEHPRKSESAPPVPFHQSHISGLFATGRLLTPSESHYNTVLNVCGGV